MAGSRKSVSPDRQALYYVGMAIFAFGLVAFLSVFVTFGRGGMSSFAGRGFGGMIFMMVGQFLMRIGSRGWAGSGLILDPDRARREIGQWDQLTGKGLPDQRSGTEPLRDLEASFDPPDPAIKLRCRNCQMLNEEYANFCSHCGTAL